MKQGKIILVLAAAVLVSQAVSAKAELWQQQLQSRFNIVETFDELQDWGGNGLNPSGSGDPRAYDGNLLPKKLDGSSSRWGYWNNKFPTAIVEMINQGPFVPGETVVNGTGAKYLYRRAHVFNGVTYLQFSTAASGSVGSFALGDTLVGQTSGANAVIKGWPNIIANHGENTWRSSGKSLMMNLGDNDNADAMAGIGAQRLGMFFGDGITGKSGYKKIHLFAMIKFAPTFFGVSGAQSDIDYISVFKFLDLCSGFTSINRFGSAADQINIEKNPQTTTEYGANVSIINIFGGGLSNAGRVFLNENISAAHLTANSDPPTYYELANVQKIMKNNNALYPATGADLNQVGTTAAAGEWFGIEIVSDIGTPDNSDGTTELYVYDKDGNIKGHYQATGQLKLVHFDHYYNKVTLGGNRRTGAATSNTDGRYWIDDFIINGARIAPTYFQLLAGGSDATPPAAAITAPAAGATVSGTTTVSVNAADNVGITKLELYVDGALKSSATAGPLSWDTKSCANGTRQLTIKAYDAAGNVGTSEACAVNVSNFVDTTPPVVSIATPTTGSNISGTVNVSMSATDNVAVTKAELYVNGTLYGVIGATPYLIAWNTTDLANGTYSLQAKAYDAAGNVGQSAVVPVAKGGDATVPAATLTIPATATALTVPVTISATDNVGVTGYWISESSAAPMATSTGWVATKPTSFTFAGAGTRTAYAWAKDAAGNVSAVVSANVLITVAPTVTAFTMSPAVKTLSAAISSFTGSTDTTGYLVTESSTRPLATASGWSATPQTSFTFSATGVRTAYAWVKDSAGTVSAYKAATVIVDKTAPVITSYSPTGGTYYIGSPIRITATASDAIAISEMKISVNGAFRSTASGGSITYDWTPTSTGNNIVRVYAYDKAGNYSLKSLFITAK